VPPPNPFHVAKKAMRDSTNYLTAVRVLKNMLVSSDMNRQLHLQAKIIYNSFLAKNPEYLRLCTEFYDKPDEISFSASMYASFVLDSLKTISKGQQVVMINEQHWQPKHRYLGNMLLSHFYNEGFRYLAVEAISENEDSLNHRKFPVQETGFYTKEPQLANMIRNALEMGYKLVSYDSCDSPADREYMQAENIYNKTLKKDSLAKVLVWAGIAHIDEAASGAPSMAHHFKEMSKINPLTIDQTSGDKNSILLNDHYLSFNKDSSSYKFSCDLFLYNNIREDDYKIKPDNPDQKITIPLSRVIKDKIKQHKQIGLMIYYKAEFDMYRFSAVPIVNRIVGSNKPIDVFLPEGTYSVIFRSPTSIVIDQSEIEVKDIGIK